MTKNHADQFALYCSLALHMAAVACVLRILLPPEAGLLAVLLGTVIFTGLTLLATMGASLLVVAALFERLLRSESHRTEFSAKEPLWTVGGLVFLFVVSSSLTLLLAGDRLTFLQAAYAGIFFTLGVGLATVGIAPAIIGVGLAELFAGRSGFGTRLKFFLGMLLVASMIMCQGGSVSP